MSGDPCPDHPVEVQIDGVCGACAIKTMVGVFSVEILPYRYETGCRSTVHCANFGFCNRCSPDLARAASFALQAMKEMGREWDGELYAEMMDLLRKATT